MDTLDCVDPFSHAGCHHPVWREHHVMREDWLALDAARRAATYAQRDLCLDTIALRFFEAGPLSPFAGGDPAIDKALAVLNAGSFDPGLHGKVVDPHVTPSLTVWVRAGLSPAATAAVVLHEARHLWQIITATETPSSIAEEERDAEVYMWPPLLRLGFEREDVAQAMGDCGYVDARARKQGGDA